MENVSEIDTGTKDHDTVLDLVGGLNSFVVTSAAIELEIFDIMAKPKGPLTAKAIAAEKEYDEDQTTRLLNTLVSLKLVERITYSDGTDMYQNTGSGRLLAHCEPDNLVGITQRFQNRFVEAIRTKKIPEEVRHGALKPAQFPAHVTVHKQQSPSKRQSTETKRHSTETKPVQEAMEQEDQAQKKEDIYSRYVSFDNNLIPHVKTIVNAFDFSIHQTAVDLGGGSGALSYAFCERYPEMKLTIFEVPPVIEMVKERFLPANEDLDVHLRAGDFMDEHKLPSADLYLLSQIIHDWRPDQVDFLLDKVFKAVLPGGGIMLLEQLLDDDRCGPSSVAVRDIFIMSHCGGGLFTVSGITELLTKHKFSDVQIVRTQPTCMYDIIYARKQHSH